MSVLKFALKGKRYVQNRENMICPHCNNEVADGAFCSVCGHPLYSTPTPSPSQQKTPENYLVWSILVTLLCCLPLGIAAIVYSVRVDSLAARGDLEGAQHSADTAKNLCIIGAILGVILIFLALLGGGAA